MSMQDMFTAFKFRSWNSSQSKFFYFWNGRYYSSILLDKSSCISERVCSEFDWSKAQQFTTLVDKVGVEIYAGDILDKYNFGACTVIFGRHLAYDTGLACQGYYLQPVSKHKDYTDMDGVFTVIGHIHQ